MIVDYGKNVIVDYGLWLEFCCLVSAALLLCFNGSRPGGQNI